MICNCHYVTLLPLFHLCLIFLVHFLMRPFMPPTNPDEAPPFGPAARPLIDPILRPGPCMCFSVLLLRVPLLTCSPPIISSSYAFPPAPAVGAWCSPTRTVWCSPAAWPRCSPPSWDCFSPWSGFVSVFVCQCARPAVSLLTCSPPIISSSYAFPPAPAVGAWCSPTRTVWCSPAAWPRCSPPSWDCLSPWSGFVSVFVCQCGWPAVSLTPPALSVPMPLRPLQGFVPPLPDIGAYNYVYLRDVMVFQTIPPSEMDHNPRHPHCYRLLAVQGYDTARLSRHTLRPRATLCQHCQALMWLEERVKGSSLTQPRFGRCCNHGKVYLEPVKGTPGPLADLLLKVCNGAAEFNCFIRKYNSAWSMTSLGVKVDRNVTYTPGTFL